MLKSIVKLLDYIVVYNVKRYQSDKKNTTPYISAVTWVGGLSVFFIASLIGWYEFIARDFLSLPNYLNSNIVIYLIGVVIFFVPPFFRYKKNKIEEIICEYEKEKNSKGWSIAVISAQCVIMFSFISVAIAMTFWH